MTDGMARADGGRRTDGGRYGGWLGGWREWLTADDGDSGDVNRMAKMACHGIFFFYLFARLHIALLYRTNRKENNINIIEIYGPVPGRQATPLHARTRTRDVGGGK